GADDRQDHDEQQHRPAVLGILVQPHGDARAEQAADEDGARNDDPVPMQLEGTDLEGDGVDHPAILAPMLIGAPGSPIQPPEQGYAPRPRNADAERHRATDDARGDAPPPGGGDARLALAELVRGADEHRVHRTDAAADVVRGLELD